MRPWIAAVAAVALLGVVLAIVGDDMLDAFGLGLIGVAAVGAVSLGFFAVGRSEDRAREAETPGRAPRAEQAERERPADSRLTARRPPRSRGDS
jgi:F0F1-type ATP synthase assembly protein I